MKKRYQVFVSSTFKDLQIERQKVLQALLRVNCIPSGMELFSAADEEQLSYIKKVIDLCDFYILIIGARYGSTDSSGLSYTEQEYDYAIQKGIDVLAFVHDKPENISTVNSEVNKAGKTKLKAFRDKVMRGRLVQLWNNSDHLTSEVIISITSAISNSNAIGWIRADSAPDLNAISELSIMRKENESLRNELQDLK
jgi:hypothetical protein